MSGGYFETNKMLERIRDRLYWVGYRSDVEYPCRNCIICDIAEGLRIRGRGHIQKYNIGAPFERMTLNITGSFPVIDSSNKYTMVILDYFTKWQEAFSTPNQEHATLELHSDQRENFSIGLCYKEECIMLRIEKTRTIPIDIHKME